MRHDRWWPPLLTALPVLTALVLLVAACGSSRADQEGDVAGVYTAAIVAVVDSAAPPLAESAVVFVTARADSKPIPLEVQAGVVEGVGDRFDVRFVDTDDEAVDDELPLAPVVDGVLVRLTAVAEVRADMTLEVERYHRADDRQLLTVRVSRSGEEWRGTIVEAVPVTAP